MSEREKEEEREKVNSMLNTNDYVELAIIISNDGSLPA